jgi:PAS domain S-box-containing protein
MILLAIEDITGRRAAEGLLSASETRYRRLFESAKDGILILDAKTGMIVDVNPFLIQLLGFSYKQFLAKKIWDIGLFKDIAANKSQFLRLQKEKYIRYEDLPLETKSGKSIHVEFVSNTYSVDNQKVIHCIIRDITERKKVEETLRISEEKFRAIFDNANDGMLLADVNTKTFYTGNNSICRMLGYSLEEIKKLGVTDIHPKGDLPYVLGQFERQTRREITVAKDLPVKRKDGSVFYADVNTSLVTLAGKTYLLGIFRDITERKKADTELAEKTEELEKFSRLSVGRELKMVELKKRIDELEGSKRK